MHQELGATVPTRLRFAAGPLVDAHPLALLTLRRVQARVKAAHAAADGSNGAPADAATLTGGDRFALGRVLRRAIERTWLTLEVLFAREAVAPRLGSGGPEALD